MDNQKPAKKAPKKKEESKENKTNEKANEKANETANETSKPAKKDDSDDTSTFNPTYQAQLVITAINQYKLEVYAKVVDLGDDKDLANLTNCMNLIRESPHEAVQNCSIILITGGDTDVTALAYTKDPTKIGLKEWIQATLESLPHNTMTLGDNFGRVTTTQDAPPIKAKETALSNNFTYLRKINAMPKDDDEDDQFIDYAEMI